MYKKLYEQPEFQLLSGLDDVIVMSGGTGFDSEEWDNSTWGGITI